MRKNIKLTPKEEEIKNRALNGDKESFEEFCEILYNYGYDDGYNSAFKRRIARRL